MTPVESMLLLGAVLVAAFGFCRLFGEVGQVLATVEHQHRLDNLWDDEPAPTVLVHHACDGEIIEFPLSDEWPLVEVAELVGRIESIAGGGGVMPGAVHDDGGARYCCTVDESAGLRDGRGGGACAGLWLSEQCAVSRPYRGGRAYEGEGG